MSNSVQCDALDRFNPSYLFSDLKPNEDPDEIYRAIKEGN